MSFNYGIIRRKREEKDVRPGEFARQLGITENYLYQVEKGLKIPSLPLLEKISKLIKVPVKRLLEPKEPKIEEVYYDYEHSYANALLKLRHERQLRRNTDERNVDLEWRTEHLTAIIHMYQHLGDIVADRSLSKSEKGRKFEELAGAIAKEGEVSFGDMVIAFHVSRAVLKNWLKAAMQVYTCKYIKSRKVVATMPGEVALRFCCFDCEYFESQKCNGYGDEKRPENLIELLERLEANGVYNRKEQAQIIEESYGRKLTEHEISEIVYRYKNKLQLPEGAFNLEIKK